MRNKKSTAVTNLNGNGALLFNQTSNKIIIQESEGFVTRILRQGECYKIRNDQSLPPIQSLTIVRLSDTIQYDSEDDCDCKCDKYVTSYHDSNTEILSVINLSDISFDLFDPELNGANNAIILNANVTLSISNKILNSKSCPNFKYLPIHSVIINRSGGPTAVCPLVITTTSFIPAADVRIIVENGLLINPKVQFINLNNPKVYPLQPVVPAEVNNGQNFAFVFTGIRTQILFMELAYEAGDTIETRVFYGDGTCLATRIDKP